MSVTSQKRGGTSEAAEIERQGSSSDSTYIQKILPIILLKFRPDRFLFFSCSGGFSIDLGMKEFLTEWSMDDPKWLVVFMIIGGWVFWSQLSFTLKHGYNSWLEKPFGFNNWARAIIGLLMFLYGFIELLRRLYLAIF